MVFYLGRDPVRVVRHFCRGARDSDKNIHNYFYIYISYVEPLFVVAKII